MVSVAFEYVDCEFCVKGCVEEEVDGRLSPSSMDVGPV